MITPTEFDDIRPYNPEELPVIFEELIADPEFKEVMTRAFPQLSYEQICGAIRVCKTNLEFQKSLVKPFLQGLMKKLSKGIELTCDDRSQLTDALYISNHRDIILDSAFLDMLLVDVIDNTVEIAIGDNLLIRPWIKKLVRVNRSFIVQRSLTMRELLASSKRLSSYIRFAIVDKKQPVWIAQREGRAKDSNDFTADSVLKMLAMHTAGDPIEALKVLNIAPTTISYEYDPCDYLKAKEYQQKRDNPEHKKSPFDDLLNMQTGLFGYKGHIHYHVAKCINDQLDTIDANLGKSEKFAVAAKMIDRAIHSNYHFWPINYYFYELLTGDTRFADKYTAEEKVALDGYLAGQLEKIDLPNKDVPFLRGKILEMYANPVKNYIKATE